MRNKTPFSTFFLGGMLLLFLFPLLVSGEEKNPFGSLRKHSLELIWEEALQGENLFRKGEYSGVLQKARELFALRFGFFLRPGFRQGV